MVAATSAVEELNEGVLVFLRVDLVLRTGTVFLWLPTHVEKLTEGVLVFQEL